MISDLTPDDLTDDAALRRAAIRIAPTMPATVDQVYWWLRDVARVRTDPAWNPPDTSDMAHARPRPEPDYRRGLRRPWWQR